MTRHQRSLETVFGVKKYHTIHKVLRGPQGDSGKTLADAAEAGPWGLLVNKLLADTLTADHSIDAETYLPLSVEPPFWV